MSGITAQRPIRESDLMPTGGLARLGSRVHLFETIDSTNTFLKSQGERAIDGEIALAEFQTAGRGRGDHRWLAPRGSSILMSVGLIEPADSPLMSMAAVAASVAACQAILPCTQHTASVRWPNDLVVHGRKVGGVLAESTHLPDGRRRLVVGVGINCLQHAGHFPPELAEKATSLDMVSLDPIDRPRLAGELVRRLDEWLQRCDPSDLPRIIGTWMGHSRDVGTQARLVQSGIEYHGTIEEILMTGDLRVRLESGEVRVFTAAMTTRLW